MNQKSTTTPAPWCVAIRGNRERFNRAIETHLPELIQAARREIAYRKKRGELANGQVTPDELAGETLLPTWHDRGECPEHVSLRTWLLGTQHRIMEQLLRQGMLRRELWALLLEDPEPPEPLQDDFATNPGQWDWHEADIPDLVPADDAPTPNEVLLFGEEETHVLEPKQRQVFLLHDRHRLPKSEVAAAIRISLSAVRSILRESRAEIVSARR